MIVSALESDGIVTTMSPNVILISDDLGAFTAASIGIISLHKTEIFDVNQLTFKYNDMIILFDATENSNHTELLAILNHLGVVDIRELK